MWSEGLGGEPAEGGGWSVLAIKQTGKKRGRWMKENEQRKKKRESESRNEQPWSSGVCQKRRTHDCRNWEEAQYQSMVQARELELEPPEAKRPTPSFAACAVAGVPRHQQTGGRQQRPQAELAVQQVVRWSVALRWSFVQFRRLQRRRLVRLTDEPPLRLSHGLQKSG